MLRLHKVSEAYIKEFLSTFLREDSTCSGEERYVVYGVSSDEFDCLQVAADQVRGVEFG